MTLHFIKQSTNLKSQVIQQIFQSILIENHFILIFNISISEVKSRYCLYWYLLSIRYFLLWLESLKPGFSLKYLKLKLLIKNQMFFCFILNFQNIFGTQIETVIPTYQTYYGEIQIDFTEIDSFIIAGWSRYSPLRLQTQDAKNQEKHSQLLFQFIHGEQHSPQLKITSLVSYQLIERTINHEIFIDSSVRSKFEYQINNILLYEGCWILTYALMKPHESTIVVGIVDNPGAQVAQKIHEFNLKGESTELPYILLCGGHISEFPIDEKVQYLGQFFGTIHFLAQSNFANIDEKNSQFLLQYDYLHFRNRDCQHYLIKEEAGIQNTKEYALIESVESELSFHFWCKLKTLEGTFRIITLYYNDIFIDNNLQNLKVLELIYHLHSFGSAEVELTYFDYTYPFLFGEKLEDQYLKRVRYDLDIDIVKEWHYVLCTYDWLERNLMLSLSNPKFNLKNVKLYENVNQLTGKLFKVVMGLPALKENEVNLEFQKFILYNCFKADDVQNCFNQFCGKCYGPIENNCLECSDFYSNSVYDGKNQKCSCPSDYVFAIGFCYPHRKSITSKTIQLQDGIESQYPELVCQYGYFLHDERCYRCPSSLKASAQCLECLTNWKTWIQSPICLNHWLQDAETNQKQYLNYEREPFVYAFNSEQLVHLEYVGYICQPQNQGCYQITEQHLGRDILVLCSSKADYNRKSQKCEVIKEQYTLQAISGCNMNLCNSNCKCCSSKGCLSCVGWNYFISVDNQNCLECNIPYCRTCVQFNRNNVFLNTIQIQTEPHSITDDLEIGCARCIEGYQFNFQIGQCVPLSSVTEDCLKSYIDADGHTVCYSSRSPNAKFTELVGCEEYISNCQTCVFDDRSSPICTKCSDGYFEMLEMRSCISCSDRYAARCSHDDEIVEKLEVFGFFGSFVKREYSKLVSIDYYLSQSIGCVTGSSLQSFSSLCKNFQKPSCLPSLYNDGRCESQRYDIINDKMRTCYDGCELCVENLNPNPPNLYYQKESIYSKRCLKSEQDLRINNQLGSVQKCTDSTEGFDGKCFYEEFVRSPTFTAEPPDPYVSFALQALQISKKTYDITDQSGFKNIATYDQLENQHLEATTLILQCANVEHAVDTLYFIAYSEVQLQNCLLNLEKDGEIYTDHLKGSVLILENIVITSKTVSLEFKFPQFKGLRLKNVKFKNIRLQSTTLFQITVQSKYYNEIVIHLENVVFENCQFENSSIFSKQGQQNVMQIQIISTYFIHCMFVGTVILDNSHLSSSKSIQIQVSFEFCNFRDSHVLIMKSNLVSSYFQVIECQFLNSTVMEFINPTDILDLALNEVKVVRSSFLQESSLITVVQNQVEPGRVSLANLMLFQVQQDSQYLFQFLIRGEISINNFQVQSLENVHTGNKISFMALFLINCTSLLVQSGKVQEFNNEKSTNSSFYYFFISYVQTLKLNDMVIYSEKAHQIPSVSRYCMKYPSKGLVIVHTFQSIILSNFQVINFNSVDTSLIQIQDKNSFGEYSQAVSILNVTFQYCNLIKLTPSKTSNFLTLQADKSIEVTVVDVSFIGNWGVDFNHDTQDSNLPYLHMDVLHGHIDLSNVRFLNNKQLGSTEGLLAIVAQNISILNFFCESFNYQLINFGNEYLTLLKMLTSGLFRVKSSSVYIKFASIHNVTVNDASVFDFSLNNAGEATLENLEMSSLRTMSASVRSLGFFFDPIDSQLILLIRNVTIHDSFSIEGSLFYIKPSYLQNLVQLNEIKLFNCLSLSRTFLYFFNPFEQAASKIKVSNIIFDNLNDEKIESKIFDLNTIRQQASYQESRIPVLTINNAEVELENLSFLGLFFCNIVDIAFQKNMIIFHVNLINMTLFNSRLMKISSRDRDGSLELRGVVIQNINFKQYQQIACISEHQDLQQYYLDCQGQKIYYRSSNIIFSSQASADLKLCIVDQQQVVQSLVEVLYTRRAQISQVQLVNIVCKNCFDGIFNLQNTQSTSISLFIFRSNICGQNGCLNLNGDQRSTYNLAKIRFINNTGMYGGSIYIKNQICSLSNIIFMNNSALKGGAIYKIGNQAIFYKDIIISNNLASKSLAIDQGNTFLDQKAISNILITDWNEIDQTYINQLPQQLNLIYDKNQIAGVTSRLEQNLISRPKDQNLTILVPSGQMLSAYTSDLFKNGVQLLLVPVSNLNERLVDLENTYCHLQARLVNIMRTGNNPFSNDSDYLSQWFLPYSSESKAYSFENITFSLNPYEKNLLELNVKCERIYQEDYRYRLIVKSIRCVPGEYFSNKICVPCQASLYSVDYDQTECYRVNPMIIKNFTSSSIELQPGYWRNSLRSREIELCFDEVKNCLGGWQSGRQTCITGHIGALCEECDIYNIRGDGEFQKVSVAKCLKCGELEIQIYYFVFSSLWILLSTLMTVQSQINQQTTLRQLRLFSRFYHILSKYNKDLSGIYIKMLMNSLQILMTIQSFRLRLQYFSLSFLDQFSNQATQFAYNVECLAVGSIDLPLVYLRGLIILTLQIFYIVLANLLHLLIILALSHQYRPSSTITSILYLYMVSQSGLILEYFFIVTRLGSLVSKRYISGVQWVQSNVSYQYDSSHLVWVYSMALPLLFLVCIAIPSILIFALWVTKGTRIFENLSYLHNEYNGRVYYWEGVKLLQRELILLSMTLYLDHIVIKGLLISIVIWGYTQLLTNQSPFEQRQLNSLEIKNMILCSSAIFLGLLLYTTSLESLDYPTTLLSLLLLLIIIMFGVLNVSNLARTYLEKYSSYVLRFQSVLSEKYPRVAKLLPRSFTSTQNSRKKLQKLFQTMRSIIKSPNTSARQSQRISYLKFSPVKELKSAQKVVDDFQV